MKLLDRVSVVVGLVLVGLVFSLIINLPTQTFGGQVLGSSVSVVLSPRWLMAGLLSALTAVGTDHVIRGHPHFARFREQYSFTFWILPALITLVSALLIPLLALNRLLWLGALGVTGITLSLTLLAEYTIFDPQSRRHTAAQLSLNFLAYALALVLFAAVYGAKARSLLSATVITLLVTLLALAILPVNRRERLRGWLYAAVIGLLMGEFLWALNYWGLNGLSGGTLLMLIFYVLTGLAQQRLLVGRLSRAMLIEFVWVFGFGLGVLFSQTPLHW